MKWLALVLGLSLLAAGCTRPYASRSYAAPAKGRSHVGVAADAQPQDVQAALQKYLEAN
jgi:hypothetical protein